LDRLDYCDERPAFPLQFSARFPDKHILRELVEYHLALNQLALVDLHASWRGLPGLAPITSFQAWRLPSILIV
jgi:hypothetical protein